MSSLLARIASTFGLTAKKERLSTGARGKVIPDLALWSQATRIGGGLSPRDVSTIIRKADTGDMARLMDLANESRQKDCHLQSVLATNEESIAGLPWQLVPPAAALLKEKKAAEWMAEGHRVRAELFLKGRYKGMEEAFLKERLERFLKLIPYAYKIAEPVARSPKGFAGVIERDLIAQAKREKEAKKST